MKRPSQALLLTVSALAAGMTLNLALAGGGGGGGGGTANSEVEPNNTKATATIADSGGIGMSTGDFLSGTTTGAGVNPGVGSVDFFRVRTAQAEPGIYRHRLAITTKGTAGHIGTLRALLQTNGIISTEADAVFQTALASTDPPRFNQWYGFGRQEQITYRISGNGATSQPYAVTLTTTPVTAIQVPALVAGNITIRRDTDGGNTNDVDMWLYNSSFTAIAGAGNDGNDTLTRFLGEGTYYLAISNFNTANNLPSPADDSFRNGSVLEFPDAIGNTSSLSGMNMGIRVTDVLTTVTAAGSKEGPFDVVWYQIVLVASTNPTGTGSANPASIARGATTLLTVAATPGTLPGSTGLGVTVDASSIGGSSSVALADNGQNGDVTAGDLTFSGTLQIPGSAATGDASLPFTVTDLENRSGTGSIVLNITASGPVNDDCSGAQVLGPESFNGGAILGSTADTGVAEFDASGDCGSAQDTRDVYYSMTADATGFWTFSTCGTPSLDTVVSVYTDCPTAESISLVSPDSCQDGFCGAANGGARVFAFLTSGNLYVVRIATKGADTGEFSLAISRPDAAPVNDDCAGAIATSSTEIPFNNSGATTSGVVLSGCEQAIAADVWFTWSPPETVGNGQWTVSVVGPVNTRLAIGPAGCPPGAAIACLTGGSTVLDAPPGSSFLVQVGGTTVQPLVGDATVVFTFIPNTGMCCTSGTLSIASQATCEGAGGTYQGDSSSGGLTGDGVMYAGNPINDIPDNSPAGVTDTISIGDPGTIANLVVRLEMEHSFIGDLTVTISNGTTTISLFDRVGRIGSGFGSGTDLAAGSVLRFHDTAAGDLWEAAEAGTQIPAGEYRPSAASNASNLLNSFAGTPITGQWTLRVADSSGGNTGRVVSWSLEVNPASVCPPPEPTCRADFNGDGLVFPDDLSEFITCFFLQVQTPGFCPLGDFNGDGLTFPDDLSEFITTFFLAVQFGC